MKTRYMAVAPGYEDHIERTQYISSFGTMLDEHGVMMITANTSLSHHFEYYSDYSYDSLKATLETALTDEDVKVIVLKFDSPGGDASGCFDCADYIREASEIKPIYAYAEGGLCSAAYLLATAAKGIYASRDSEIGSIGVICSVSDSSSFWEKLGLKTKTFRSKNATHKALSPMSEEGGVDIQEKIDVLEDFFVAKVAENRGVEVDTVLKEFGQGKTFLADEAKSKGMIDGVMSYEAFMKDIILSSLKEEGEGEDMVDVSKFSEEEKKALLAQLGVADASLSNEREEIVKAERMRVATLNSYRTEATAGIIDKAIAEGKEAGEVMEEIVNSYKAENESLRTKLEALDPIKAQAESDQEVNPPIDDVEKSLEASIAKINEARKED